MAKGEIIDPTLSDSDSDGDFIQAKNQSRAQVSSPRYRYAYLTELVHVRSNVQ